MNRRELIYGTVVVTLVGTISIALTVQGWKSRVPAFDLLTYIYSAHNFLASGTLPQHGDTGSYGSFKPPGSAWLMLPSALLFSDLRLSEYAGTTLLHVSTLLGIFLLACRYFGLSAALFALPLYGLSAHGLFLAGSLWPNGRPDFYIWIVYFTSRWVLDRQPRFLAAACAVWGLGMNVDMAITPVLFILPAAWLYYRPPLRTKPLLVAAVVVLFAWAPYLLFQATRGFADVRSQLLQQHIFPANYRETWCDETLELNTWMQDRGASDSVLVQLDRTPASATGLVDKLVTSTRVTKDKLLYNYEPASGISGVAFALLLITLCSMLILSVSGTSSARPTVVNADDLTGERLRWIALGMILCGALIKVLASPLSGLEGFLHGSKILLLTRVQVIFVWSGIGLLGASWLASIANDALSRSGVQIQTERCAHQTRLLVMSLLVPWCILLLLAEPNKPERFMWLWPLQSIFLAAFFTNVLPRFQIPRAITWLGIAFVAFAVIDNSFLRSRVESWAKNGWAGRDAEEIEIVDTISHQLKQQGKDKASVGYQIFIYPFMANYNISNPIYKAGAEIDLLFKYRQGVSNTNQCAEGLSPDDEYRIVQTRPKRGEWQPREYFEVPLDKNFRLLQRFGLHHVFKRE